MKNTLRTIGAFAVALLVVESAIAKDWRGLVPLKSTRADVARLLGRPKGAGDSPWYYNRSKEIVVVRNQTEPCDPFGLGWRVPPGTVVGIGVIPKGKHRRDEYQLPNDAKVEKRDAGFSYYSDYTTGLTIETHNNIVTLADYFPTASEESLRCPRVEKCCVDTFSTFDEYGELTFADEKARLDNFFIQITNSFERGAIKIFGPSESIRRQQMKRAVRAKAYLVKERGLEPERLLLVDGGFKESPETRLSLYGIGGFASWIQY